MAWPKLPDGTPAGHGPALPGREGAGKTALLVGAAGFVGGYLAQELAGSGWHVHGTHLPSEAVSAPLEAHVLDILDREACAALLGAVKPDAVFHLAAQSSVALSWKNPGLTIDVNIKGAVNVLEAVRAAGLEKSCRVLLIGSAEEYGAPLPDEVPVREDNPLRPSNLYAITKRAQNEIGMLYARAYGMDVVATRSFNHFGPGQAPIFVMADFAKQLAEAEKGLREPVLRTGNLAARRDFTDVRDVVRAYRLLALYGRAGETYNVGSGRAVAIEELLRRLLALTETPVTWEVDPARLRPVDVPEVRADITKLQAVIGWRPEIDIDTTLADTLAYWRGQA